MSYNPYSDDTVKSHAELYPPMGDLQPRQPPQAAPMQTPPVTELPSRPADLLEGQDDRQRKARTAKFAIGKFNDYLVWFLTVLETILALRFLLKLIGADPGNPFAGFLYTLTNILLLPFLDLVPSPSIHPPNQSFEFSTLIGMLVYFLLFYALKRFAKLIISPPEDTAE
jgi:uncharacterized protein YggT (Ycf19 family)